VVATSEGKCPGDCPTPTERRRQHGQSPQHWRNARSREKFYSLS